MFPVTISGSVAMNAGANHVRPSGLSSHTKMTADNRVHST